MGASRVATSAQLAIGVAVIASLTVDPCVRNHPVGQIACVVNAIEQDNRLGKALFDP